MNFKKLGNNIHNARIRHNMSQEELCEKTAVNQAYISYIERGLKKPSAELLARIAKCLEMSVDELIKGC